MSRQGAAVLVAAMSLLVGGCSTAEAYRATPLPSSTPAPAPTTGTAPTGQTTSTSDVVRSNCLQSYAPAGPLPTPGQMPAGSAMARIQARGRLIAGVSADSLRMGARNPLTNTIEGFDIDLVRAVAEAILGRSDAVELRVITASQRESVLRDGSVDLVARLMTITCERWRNIAFSTEYYRSGQKLLVHRAPTTSDVRITGIQDLEGKRVCAPRDTTTMTKLLTFPGVLAVGADGHTGCLVMFQKDLVDAIIGDDTVLAGLAKQDPYAEVVKGPAFTAEPYGLGMNKADVDLVRFVNGVLERVRADGRWTRSYDRWLRDALGTAPSPPAAVYGRAP